MIGIIEHDVAEAFAAFRKAIRRGDDRSAAQMVQNLLSSQDPEQVWKFLLAAASTEISHTEQKTVILVRSLYENWRLDKKPVFAVHAVLALVSAPKGTSAMDYIARKTD
jgi:membrane protein required for beta-lactamase induction